MLNAICQPTDKDIFSTHNIGKCEYYVLTTQRRLDKAVASDNKPRVQWFIYILTKRSRAAKIVATHRITKINEGRYTAGVDGVAMPRTKAEQEIVRSGLYQEIDITRKPDAIRRVFIPKPNGKQRPLGIPTLRDRIKQEIIRQAIEPICEFHFHKSSHGFRPKRCCQDAMVELFQKLSHKTSRQWVVEGDIKGCFDNIKHDHITDTLKSWHVTDGINQSISLMLKSKILHEGNMTASEKGTPQGGVISPLLANVALTTLDEFCQQFGRNTVSPIVRYADDFVIVCESKKLAMITKARVARHLREMVGLELSGEKTRITHITDGFDFLGFSFRKYKEENIGVSDEILLIKPQAEKVNDFRHKLKGILKECKSSTQEVVIRRINPVIRGWGNYYRHVVSKATFGKLDHHIWQKLYQWARGKHQGKLSGSTIEKHFSMRGKSWVFNDKEAGIQASILSSIPIKRFVKVRIDHRVYDVNSKEYWEKREYQNAKDSILGSGELSALFGMQKGKCAYCKQSITKDEISRVEFHRHHMKPRSYSGDEKLSNLRLLHKACHVDLHAMYTRKEMAEYTDNGIDYLRLMKAKPS